MANLSEGDWSCTVLGGTIGMDDREQLVVRINVKIDDGPDKGRACTYEDVINNKSAPYIARSCMAAGWSGKLPIEQHLTADIDAWIKATGGKTTITIEHLLIKKGKQYDKWVEGGCKGDQPVWAKAKALGRGGKPLVAPTAAASADANDYLRKAFGEAETEGTPPQEEAPPITEKDIPFITSARVSEIAKVLR